MIYSIVESQGLEPRPPAEFGYDTAGTVLDKVLDQTWVDTLRKGPRPFQGLTNSYLDGEGPTLWASERCTHLVQGVPEGIKDCDGLARSGGADVSEQISLDVSVQAFRRQADGQFNRHRVPVLVSDVDAASIVGKRVDFNVVVNGDPQTQGAHK